MQYDLSIIIVSFNTKKLTSDCLSSIKKSLRNSPFTTEVIVVDNASTDGSVEMIEHDFPWVVLVQSKENLGFGRANNVGIRQARGTYVFLLNSDTVIVGNAIEKLYECATHHPKSFIGPKLLNMDRSDQTSCGPFFTLPVTFAVLFLKGDRLKMTRWSPSKMTKVDWVSGAAMIAPRQVFLDDLLFDEKIFMYMEEIDLLMRARKKGYTTYFYPGSTIVHLGSGSSTNRRKGPVLNIYKGFVYLYSKHYGPAKRVLLRGMLKLKALFAILTASITGNKELKDIYAEAYRLV